MGGSAVITKNMSKKPPSKDKSSADDTGADSAGADKEGVIAASATTDTEDLTEVLASDPDPVQLGEAAVVAAAEGTTETRAAAESLSDAPAGTDSNRVLADVVSKSATAGAASSSPPKARIPWFGLFNFLLILALAGAAGYYWREQQKLAADYQANNQADLANMQQQLQLVEQTSSKRLQSSLSPLESRIGNLNDKVDELGLGQQGLRESGEKLYELFGRDKNAWQLAEVEYLMRVAQHKLILQDDFEGAAITLQAASDRIGLTGDPGLLPVRVMISEEIADLKTRRRADLVGMTLILAQLGRQVRGLQPGFAVRVEQISEEPAVESSVGSLAELGVDPQTLQDWFDRSSVFLDSLISIRKESAESTEVEANIVDVSEVLEDNLKLARWAILERDANQYQLLIDRSLRLFGEFYDLDNAANHDFMTQLQELQKMVIKPEKPDITGSLRELQRILSQRAVAPQPAATQPAATQPAAPQPAAPQPADMPAAESDNG
jgi:uroporphyrin-3 C-methyltransferase